MLILIRIYPCKCQKQSKNVESRSRKKLSSPFQTRLDLAYLTHLKQSMHKAREKEEKRKNPLRRSKHVSESPPRETFVTFINSSYQVEKNEQWNRLSYLLVHHRLSSCCKPQLNLTRDRFSSNPRVSFSLSKAPCSPSLSKLILKIHHNCFFGDFTTFNSWCLFLKLKKDTKMRSESFRRAAWSLWQPKDYKVSHFTAVAWKVAANIIILLSCPNPYRRFLMRTRLVGAISQRPSERLYNL